MPLDFPRAAEGAVRGARDPLRRRRGAGRASAAPGRCGRSSTTASTPDLLVSGKSLGGGLPLAAVTGRAELMDAVPVGGLGGTFGGNPVACAAACVVLDTVATPEFRARADALALRSCARGWRRWPPTSTRSSTSAASARCWRSSSRPSVVPGVVAAARERGLLLLSCGLHGEVDPAAAADHDLRRGAGRRARRARGGAQDGLTSSSRRSCMGASNGSNCQPVDARRAAPEDRRAALDVGVVVVAREVEVDRGVRLQRPRGADAHPALPHVDRLGPDRRPPGRLQHARQRQPDPPGPSPLLSRVRRHDACIPGRGPITRRPRSSPCSRTAS